MEPAIVLDRVSKTFPGAAAPAVAGCSLTVHAGELLVVLGSSGSGKTTLLKMINRIHEPTAGRIVVNGRDVLHTPVTELRRGIGYVIQQVGLFPHQTVAQNIGTVPRILGWDQRRIAQRVDFLLELMQLPPAQYRDRLPRQLSGGEQQRVGIARALAADPPILLMDEPFGALDAITRAALQDELLDIQRRLKKTIVFVTHDVDEALKLADRIVVMEKGRIEQAGRPIELLSAPATPFVRRLLGADNLLQHLRVLSVRDVMEPRAPARTAESGPAVTAGTNLRDALSVLLQIRGEPVPVVDEAGAPVGQLRWEHVMEAASGGRGAARPGTPGRPAGGLAGTAATPRASDEPVRRGEEAGAG